MQTVNTAVRKTTKYYRDILAGDDTRKAVSVIPEVIRKYGINDQYNRHYIKVKTEFNWNHQIEGFMLGNNGRLYAEIYWQGDSTDGTDCELAENLIWGKTIAAAWDNIGGAVGYVQRHSPLNITREEFALAVKALAKELTPERIKARKMQMEREKYASCLNKKLNMLVLNPMYNNRYYGAFHNNIEKYHNGECAVRELVFSEPKKFATMPDDELKPILKKVFEQNEKRHSAFQKDERGHNIYDINY